MRTRNIILCLALAWASAAIGCSGPQVADNAAPSQVTKTGLRSGMLAPDIVGQDLTGAEMSLSDFRGQVVILEFWSST